MAVLPHRAVLSGPHGQASSGREAGVLSLEEGARGDHQALGQARRLVVVQGGHGGRSGQGRGPGRRALARACRFCKQHTGWPLRVRVAHAASRSARSHTDAPGLRKDVLPQVPAKGERVPAAVRIRRLRPGGRWGCDHVSSWEARDTGQGGGGRARAGGGYRVAVEALGDIAAGGAKVKVGTVQPRLVQALHRRRLGVERHEAAAGNA